MVFLAFGVVSVKIHELVETIGADVVLSLVGLIGPKHLLLTINSPIPSLGLTEVLMLFTVGAALLPTRGLLDHDLIGSAWRQDYWVTL